MTCPSCGGSEISLRFAVYYEQQVFSFNSDGTPADVGDWIEVDPASSRSVADNADSDRRIAQKTADRAGARMIAHPQHEYACDGCGETFSSERPVSRPPNDYAHPRTPVNEMADDCVVIAGITFPLALNGDSITVWSLRERLAPSSLLAVFGALAEQGIPLRDAGIPVASVRAAVARVSDQCGPAAIQPARIPWRAPRVRTARAWLMRALHALVARVPGKRGAPLPTGFVDVLAGIHAIATRGADNDDAYAALQQIERMAESALMRPARLRCVVFYTCGGIVRVVSTNASSMRVILHG
jgi:hypothetical protein